MKIFSVVFSGKQPFKAEQLVAATDADAAKLGLTELLANRIDGFEVLEAVDATKSDEPEQGELTLN